MVKLTKNNQSLQLVVPLEMCMSLGWKAGDEITPTQQGHGIYFEKKFTEPKVTKDVYTIGYEGRTVDKFLHELIIRDIKQLIDVRQLAFSRKAGFSKSSLKAHLEGEGITYRHIPELGSPSDVRHVYKEGGSIVEFMDQYSAYLDEHQEAYEELRGFVLSKPSVLMCFEKNYLTCHRKIIAQRLFKDGFRLTHL